MVHMFKRLTTQIIISGIKYNITTNFFKKQLLIGIPTLKY